MAKLVITPEIQAAIDKAVAANAKEAAATLKGAVKHLTSVVTTYFTNEIDANAADKSLKKMLTAQKTELLGLVKAAGAEIIG